MKKIAEDVKNSLKLPFVDITLSVGIAFNEGKESLEELIKKADEALYSSKENGKNQITYYGQQKVYKKERPVNWSEPYLGHFNKKDF